MKVGTAGTLEDPHRPDVADILKSAPPGAKWRVDQAKGEIVVVCDPVRHAIVAAVRPEKK